MWRSKIREILFKSIEVPFDKLPDIQKGKVELLKLISKFSTPFFLVDIGILKNRVRDIKFSCQKNWSNYKIAFSFKTNYEVAKLNVFKDLGLWAEVVSGREYKMAKALGYDGNKIIFNGPLKKTGDLKYALNDGALVFVDNLDELNRVKKYSILINKKVDIGIRLRTKIPKLNESRFGFSIDNGEALEIVNLIESNPLINLVGLHIHIGTDIDNPKRYQFATMAITNFIVKNIKSYKDKIKFIDFGGGFPSHGIASFGRMKWNPKPINSYIGVITKQLKTIFKDKRPTLIFEPGRYLVDDAMMFVSEVTNRRIAGGTQILTTNATTTMLPLVYYRPQIVKIFGNDLNEKKNNSIKSIVYGASCREDDVVYNQPLPNAEIGDILVYFVVGAYNQNMACDFIFKKPEMYQLANAKT